MTQILGMIGASIFLLGVVVTIVQVICAAFEDSLFMGIVAMMLFGGLGLAILVLILSSPTP